ncbi:MAG: SpoIIE family protein phosphatase [Acidithiobacillales bacterium]
MVGLAACYMLAAFAGLKFAIPPGNATAIWPASGIALAGVLLLGPRASPGIWLGATLANLTTSVAFPVAAAIGLGNTLEALIAAWFLRRRGRTVFASFRSARGVFVFAAVAAVASFSAATVGVLALKAAGHLLWPSLALNWVTWSLGDIAGMVIVTPFLIALRGGPRFPATPARWLEAGLATLALVVVSQSLFGGVLEGASARDLLYLPLFLLIWLALRFDVRGVTAATLLMAAAAVWGTSRGVGVYGGRAVPDSLLNQQVLMISYALTGLALVATVNRRRRAESVLLRSRRRLERVVSERTTGLLNANRALRGEVAERKRLQEMEQLRLAAALNSAGEGIIITGADATITHVNPAFELMTGYSRDDVVGKNPRLLKSGRHDAGFYRQLWEAISHGDVWRGSFVDRKKDASLYEVDSTIAPIHEADGSLAGYVAVNRDVTLQRKGERALRDSESRLRTIFESAADGIITVDENGLIESANTAVEAIFGYAIGELVGRPVTTLLPPSRDDEASGFQEGPHLEGVRLPLGVVRELVGQRRDGTTFHMDLVLNELLLEGRRLFAGFIRDATERHALLDAERALLSANEELRLARVIQQRFYPAFAPAVPGFDIAGASEPAEYAGGDYFDYLWISGRELALVIGDVSGHGLGPALLMSQTRAYLRTLLLLTHDVSDLLTRLNSFLAMDWGEEHFVTLFLARLVPEERKMTYASGGHQSYLLRADGRVETLAATGIPLGIMPTPIRGAPGLSLQPGDLLLMVTDGIEETVSPDDRELGRGRVLEVAQANRHRPASEIVTALFSAASDFAAGGVQKDDVTAVVVKVLD